MCVCVCSLPGSLATSLLPLSPSPPARSEAPSRFSMERGAGLDDADAGLVSVCVAFGEAATFAIEAVDPSGEQSARILLSTTPDAHLEHTDGADGAELALPAWSAAIVRVR